ncbi:pilus assembly protein TadG-related protein [Hoeflea sp. TYP-13]|uniref:TadE/TadG family type IV pilus assembly protein n=1 Tax=Hoeflea sp. TYP-13 TaxID=3230023 RepID=UPI0034C60D19
MNTDSIKTVFHRFLRDERGNFLMLFGLGVGVLFLAAGLAVDYSVGLMNKTRVNNALDAATIATARALASGDISASVDGEVETYLKAIFAANLDVDDLDASIYAIDSYSVDTAAGTVSATASIDQPLYLLQVGTSSDSMTVATDSAVAYGVGNVEVAMVLDVTGSMRGSKLSALQDSAELGVEELLSVNTDSDEKVRISIVPYAIGVNVGSDLGKYVYADFFYETSDAPAFDSSLYSSTGVGYDWSTLQSGYWSGYESGYTGCGNYYTQLDGGQNFKFAGGFRSGGGFSYGSSYGFDGYTFGDAFIYQAKKGSGKGGGSKVYAECWDFVTESDGTNSDYCASDRKAPTTSGLTSYQYTDANPSYGMISRDARLEEDECPDSTIVTLTSNETTLKNAISGFSADGWTGGHIGLQWGWYTVSYDWRDYMPSGSEPADHTDPDEDLKKYIIMMTDGVFNTAYADVDYDGFSTGSQSSKSYDHFDELCTAIKNDDITIFTIGFYLSDDDAKDALDDCATDDTAEVTYYYDVDSASELEDTFEDIANTINSLRLTK